MTLNVIRYESLKDIIEAYYDCSCGESVDLLKKISNTNTWGFCEDKKTLHLYVSEYATLAETIHLIGHEIGHTFSCDEDYCDRFADMCLLAHTMAAEFCS